MAFSIEVFKYLSTVPYRKEYEVFRTQISRCATAVGANYEEAQNSSIKEFAQKVRIALREGRETEYWFRILQKLNLGEQNLLENLLLEVNELCLMLGSIVSKVDKKIKTPNI